MCPWLLLGQSHWTDHFRVCPLFWANHAKSCQLKDYFEDSWQAVTWEIKNLVINSLVCQKSYNYLFSLVSHKKFYNYLVNTETHTTPAFQSRLSKIYKKVDALQSFSIIQSRGLYAISDNYFCFREVQFRIIAIHDWCDSKRNSEYISFFSWTKRSSVHPSTYLLSEIGTLPSLLTSTIWTKATPGHVKPSLENRSLLVLRNFSSLRGIQNLMGVRMVSWCENARMTLVN